MYFFCAVPDLILKKTSTTHAGPAVHIDDTDDQLDVIELKQGQLTTGKTAEYPHEYTQIFANLHFLAMAFTLKALKKGRDPCQVKCSALLLSKTRQMILVTLNLQIKEINNCTLSFETATLNAPSLPVSSLTGSDVCVAIDKLLSC